MTSKSTLQSELTALRTRMEEIAAEIEAMPDGANGVPMLAHGDDYWVLNEFAEVEEYEFHGDEADREAASIGNVFRTEQEAEDRLFKLKIEQRLRNLAGGFRPKDGEPHDYIYRSGRGEIDSGMWGCTIQGSIPFRPGEAQKAIDAIGQADLKRYFEVAP